MSRVKIDLYSFIFMFHVMGGNFLHDLQISVEHNIKLAS